MSDSSGAPQANPALSVAITPMRRTAEGIWESAERDGAQFYLVELVQNGGEDAEVVVECQDARSAALAARVVAATVAALGLADSNGDSTTVSAFDDETATLLAENPTPEVTAPAGEWVEEDAEEPGKPLQ
ncbi:hypothetical protein HB662_05815 [Roseomonas frigidaquae]|uniref:Uncharacterized protein n=1 Tax=Falsiroseomonas frigidaquae TaxID=487318 RepID=A0ABX1EWE7_9PROT|nr:hypothetical protein [Falsiroseomonas frigidaquae]NKE44285.1 hypothetical protein [Falsiroseomonas frigidaquae]